MRVGEESYEKKMKRYDRGKKTYVQMMVARKCIIRSIGEWSVGKRKLADGKAYSSTLEMTSMNDCKNKFRSFIQEVLIPAGPQTSGDECG